ncbi:MAG: SGNH/GDSL hydrolase family protein, partial [Eggerthellaceae bacterium]|nr:SGNH/GDSL hydrolase family protein [Eggerthellaceae bacterium]
MGTTFSIMGDSISTFEGMNPKENAVYYTEPQTEISGVTDVRHTWWMQLIRHFGGRLAKNGSYSGSLVEGIGFPAGDSDERVAQLACADGSDPDVIVLFMGINDYGWAGAYNQAKG